jgi:hypothetical protein
VIFIIDIPVSKIRCYGAYLCWYAYSAFTKSAEYFKENGYVKATYLLKISSFSSKVFFDLFCKTIADEVALQ